MRQMLRNGIIILICLYIAILTTRCKAKCTSSNINPCKCQSTTIVQRGGSSESTKNNTRNHSTSGSTPTPIISSNRRACHFYVWNALSALLHRWCHHLQRDNIYEGRGGKKFVRIQPGSMLQLLHPCSKYSTDKCVICGGTFRDHLTLWWAKHYYTPFDRYLDRVYQDGVIVQSVYGSSDSIKRPSSSRNARSTTTYSYHRRYVLDITHLFDGIQSPREKKRKLQLAISQKYKSQIRNVSIDRMQQHKWRLLPGQEVIRYLVPLPDVVSNPPTKTLILLMAQDICFDAVNRLLDLQEIDCKRTNLPSR